MVIVGLVLMVAFGSRFGPAAFGLLALGTGLGIAYDLWLKRTSWSWLPYLLALPLLPIWVFSALGKPEPRLLLLYPLGALATVGVHLAQTFPDVTIDRAAGLQTVSSRSGSLWTFVLAWLATLSAPVLAWLAIAWTGDQKPRDAIAFAAGIALLLLATNITLISFNRRIGAEACFPLVALSTLVSGLTWTLTVAR
jgi:4-hydroxybenzoate polyprenyltransferase